MGWRGVKTNLENADDDEDEEGDDLGYTRQGMKSALAASSAGEGGAGRGGGGQDDDDEEEEMQAALEASLRDWRVQKSGAGGGGGEDGAGASKDGAILLDSSDEEEEEAGERAGEILLDSSSEEDGGAEEGGSAGGGGAERAVGTERGIGPLLGERLVLTGDSSSHRAPADSDEGGGSVKMAEGSGGKVAGSIEGGGSVKMAEGGGVRTWTLMGPPPGERAPMARSEEEEGEARRRETREARLRWLDTL